MIRSLFSLLPAVILLAAVVLSAPLLVSVIPIDSKCPLKGRKVCQLYEQAKRGEVQAQFTLAQAYERGEGVKKNAREAVHWYLQAAESNLTDWQNNFGVAYEPQQGYRKMFFEVWDWYSRVAGQGWADARFYLGLEPARDVRQAARKYRPAAERGNAFAQYLLGLAYARGDGIARNSREAVLWWRMVAQQENTTVQPLAQYRLATAYWNGVGVVRDHHEAICWYHKAAERGNVYAQNHLGWAYWKGVGIDKDKRTQHEAYIWLSIAQAIGDRSAAASLRQFQSGGLEPVELRVAQEEANQRMDAIDRHRKSAMDADIRVAHRETNQRLDSAVFGHSSISLSAVGIQPCG